MTLHEKQRRFTQLFTQLLVWAQDQGLEIVLDMVARTPEEQARLVKAGLSRTLHSKHVTRLAGDVLLFNDGQYLTDGTAYRPLGRHWTTLDPANVWGGDWASFPDYDHFEYGG